VRPDEIRARAVQVNTSLVVNLLVAGEYQALENMTQGMFLSAEDMRAVVEAHGHQLIRPLDSAYDDLEPKFVGGADQPTFDVAFYLWSADEGRSRLRLDLRFVERDGRNHRLQILGVSDRAGR
jgi:hypothetical protein